MGLIRIHDDLPHKIQIEKNNRNLYEMEDWCKNNLGPRWEAIGNRQGIWCCFWAGVKQHKMYDFYFANESDMIWFKLSCL